MPALATNGLQEEVRHSEEVNSEVSVDIGPRAFAKTGSLAATVAVASLSGTGDKSAEELKAQTKENSKKLKIEKIKESLTAGPENVAESETLDLINQKKKEIHAGLKETNKEYSEIARDSSDAIKDANSEYKEVVEEKSGDLKMAGGLLAAGVVVAMVAGPFALIPLALAAAKGGGAISEIMEARSDRNEEIADAKEAKKDARDAKKAERAAKKAELGTLRSYEKEINGEESILESIAGLFGGGKETEEPKKEVQKNQQNTINPTEKAEKEAKEKAEKEAKEKAEQEKAAAKEKAASDMKEAANDRSKDAATPIEDRNLSPKEVAKKSAEQREANKSETSVGVFSPEQRDAHYTKVATQTVDAISKGAVIDKTATAPDVLRKSSMLDELKSTRASIIGEASNENKPSAAVGMNAANLGASGDSHKVTMKVATKEANAAIEQAKTASKVNEMSNAVAVR